MFTPSQEYIGVLPSDYLAIGSGFHRGDARRIMSRSELKRFAWCPSRWLAGGKDDDETSSTEWGSLIDCLALTPQDFESRYAITPATYPAKGKKKDDPAVDKKWSRNADFCKEWEAEREARGVRCLTPTEEAKARSAVTRLFESYKIAAALDSAKTQAVYVADWQDKTTGISVPVKIMVDAVPTGSLSQFLADLKTTANAHPAMWPREVNKHWYDAQAALYLDVFNACTGEERNSFLHLKQENFPPFETGTASLSAEFIENGRTKYRNALADYCACLDSGKWPDYDAERPGVWCADGFPICEPEPFMMLQPS